MIILSSIALAVDNPLNDPNGGMATFLGNLDFVFNGYFIIEMLIKIVTLGFLFTKRAYMKVGYELIWPDRVGSGRVRVGSGALVRACVILRLLARSLTHPSLPPTPHTGRMERA